MKPLFSIILLIFVHFGLSNCKSSKPFTPNELISNKGEKIVAWNEDTVNSYQLLLTSKGFYYTVIKTDSSKENEQYFSGKYRISRDTIVLTYKGGSQPIDAEDYLLIEGSGNYLIQPFEGGKRKMFLQFQRRPVF